MSLTIQFNINDTEILDETSELAIPTPGFVTESLSARGVAVIEAAVTVRFGAFDPGLPYGSPTSDFVLQCMQVSSAGGFESGDVALAGPQPPGVGGTPFRFVFHTLTGADDLFIGAQIIPTGYKLSFTSDADGPHVIRLTYWPITRVEQVAAIMAV